MKIAKLIPITLLESNVAGSTYNEYASGTTYSSTDTPENHVKVSFEADGTTPRTPIEEYLSIADSNTGNYPPDNPEKWSLLGASNRWAMFDGYVNTQTENTDAIVTEVDSSHTNKVGLFKLQANDVTLTQIVNNELIVDGDCSTDSFIKGIGWSYDSSKLEYDCDGSQTADSELYQDAGTIEGKQYIVKFTVRNYSAGNVAGMVGGTKGTDVNANGDYVQVITAGSAAEDGVIADVDFNGTVDNISIMQVVSRETISLDQSYTPDYWEYFFAPFEYKEDFTWEYSLYGTAKIRVEISPRGGSTKCGMFALGIVESLGPTQYDLHVSIDDYSKKSTDSLGRTYLKQGNYAKKIECDFWLDNKDLDIVRKALADDRGLPSIIDANGETTNFGSLVVYGFIKSFDIIIPGPIKSKCSFEGEGLI